MLLKTDLMSASSSISCESLKNTSAKILEKLWDELFQNRSSINRHLKNTCSMDASKSVSFASVFFMSFKFEKF
jgi:hypothetical protein